MMAKGQVILTVSLMIASLLIFITSIVLMIIGAIKNRIAPEKHSKAGMGTALTFSGVLLLSLWLMRFAVGYFTIVVADAGTQHLTPLEEVVNSLFRAVRTFSMEEGYTDYVLNIKAFVAEILPDTYKHCSVIQFVVTAYASLLNLLAPIIGGAIILEILASIFPKIRLRWACIKRPKYFFSELSDASLALAKSIYQKEKAKKPVLVFADTYVDEKSGKKYDLVQEAKKYGAICIRDDLVHIRKPRFGKRAYLLMHEDEFANLQTLMRLTENHNVTRIKNAYIYLLVQSDAYVQIERQIYKELENAKKKPLKEDEKLTIIPVNGYHNLVQNLFVDVPLYEPLINKKDKTKLNLTILGNGMIGTEAFLNAYWFGQMMISGDDHGKKTMSECEVTINIVSRDSEEVFWSRIDYVNPEIKGTVAVLGDCAGSNKTELLSYDSEGRCNAPYCRVRYIKSDVKVGEFWDSDSEETQQLLESDYFVVALGSDADNITIADKLRNSIGKKHMEDTGSINSTVIAYAVFDSEIARKLNGDRYYQSRKDGHADIYMYAFGSLDSVYSYDNVYMSRYMLLAEVIGGSYNQSQIQQRLKDDNQERSSNANKNYDYWANLARAMHIKYKAFSLGFMKKSIFDYNSDAGGIDAYNAYVKENCKKYIALAMADSARFSSPEMIELYKDVQLKKHVLAWLEHRRWNAFTRTMGYRHTSAEILFDHKDCQKDMELKLHSCLVEARRPQLEEGDTYIYADFLENGLVDENTTFASFKTKPLDHLDQVSYERKQRNPQKAVADFKMYDYYRYEFYYYVDAADLAQLL